MNTIQTPLSYAVQSIGSGGGTNEAPAPQDDLTLLAEICH